jgi:hypothetical protein
VAGIGAVAGVALVLGGCGGSSKPEVCGKRDALKSAVNDLTSVNPITDGTDEVKARVSAVQKAFDDLAKAAGDKYSTQISAVRSSASKLASDVQGLTGSDKTAAIASLSTDAKQVTDDLNALLSAVQSAC